MPDDEIIVNTPEGDRLHFPSGTDQQTIGAAMGKLKAQKAGGIPGAPNGLPEVPSARSEALAQAPKGGMGDVRTNLTQMQPSPLGGAAMTSQQEQFVNQRLPQVQQRVSDIRSAALAAGGGSIGAGLASDIPGAVGVGLRMLGSGGGAALGDVAGRAISGQQPTVKEATQVGGSAAIGQGIGEGAGNFLKWLTSSKSAGAQLLQQASAKAGNAPVTLSPRTNELVDDLVQQSKLGGKPIKVISDLLERVGPSTKDIAGAQPGPLTYDEARILQSNMSQLSAEESMGLKGSQKGLLKQLAGSFSRDVQNAANQAGAGAEHAAGMREYATASARNRALSKGAKIAGYGGAGYIAEQGIKKGIAAIKQP